MNLVDQTIFPETRTGKSQRTRHMTVDPTNVSLQMWGAPASVTLCALCATSYCLKLCTVPLSTHSREPQCSESGVTSYCPVCSSVPDCGPGQVTKPTKSGRDSASPASRADPIDCTEPGCSSSNRCPSERREGQLCLLASAPPPPQPVLLCSMLAVGKDKRITKVKCSVHRGGCPSLYS